MKMNRFNGWLLKISCVSLLGYASAAFGAVLLPGEGQLITAVASHLISEGIVPKSTSQKDLADTIEAAVGKVVVDMEASNDRQKLTEGYIYNIALISILLEGHRTPVSTKFGKEQLFRALDTLIKKYDITQPIAHGALEETLRESGLFEKTASNGVDTSKTAAKGMIPPLNTITPVLITALEKWNSSLQNDPALKRTPLALHVKNYLTTAKAVQAEGPTNQGSARVALAYSKILLSNYERSDPFAQASVDHAKAMQKLADAPYSLNNDYENFKSTSATYARVAEEYYKKATDVFPQLEDLAGEYVRAAHEYRDIVAASPGQKLYSSAVKEAHQRLVNARDALQVAKTQAENDDLEPQKKPARAEKPPLPPPAQQQEQKGAAPQPKSESPAGTAPAPTTGSSGGGSGQHPGSGGLASGGTGKTGGTPSTTVQVHFHGTGPELSKGPMTPEEKKTYNPGSPSDATLKKLEDLVLENARLIKELALRHESVAAGRHRDSEKEESETKHPSRAGSPVSPDRSSDKLRQLEQKLHDEMNRSSELEERLNRNHQDRVNLAAEVERLDRELKDHLKAAGSAAEAKQAELEAAHKKAQDKQAEADQTRKKLEEEKGIHDEALIRLQKDRDAALAQQAKNHEKELKKHFSDRGIEKADADDQQAKAQSRIRELEQAQEKLEKEKEKLERDLASAHGKRDAEKGANAQEQEKLKDALRQKDAEINDLKEQAHALNEEVKHAQTEAKNQVEDSARHEANAQTLSEQLSHEQAANKKLHDDLLHEIEEVRKQAEKLKKAQTQSEEHQAQVEKLKQEKAEKEAKLQTLASAHGAHQAEKKQLALEMEGLKKNVTDQEKLAQHAEARAKDLEKALEGRDKKVSDLEDRLKKSEESRKHLFERASKLQEEQKQSKINHDKQRKDFESKLSDAATQAKEQQEKHSQSLAAKDAEIDKHQSLAKGLESKRAKAQQDLEATARKAEEQKSGFEEAMRRKDQQHANQEQALSKEIEALKQTNEQHQATRAQQNREIQKHQEDLKQEKKRIADLQKQLTLYDQQGKEKDEHLKALKKDLADRLTRIQSLQMQIADQTEKLKAAQEKDKKNESDIDRLKRDAEQTQADRVSHQSEIRALRENLDKRDQENKTQAQALGTLSAEKDKLKEKNEELSRQLESEKKNSALQKIAHEQTKKDSADRFKELKDQFNKNHDEIKKQRDALQTQIEQIQEEKDKLKQEIAEYQGEKGGLQQVLADQKAQLKGLEEGLKKQAQTLDSATKKNHQSAERMKELQSQLESANKKGHDAERLRKDFDQLKSEFKKQADELSTRRSSMDRLSSEYDQLKQTHEALKNDFQRQKDLTHQAQSDLASSERRSQEQKASFDREKADQEQKHADERASLQARIQALTDQNNLNIQEHHKQKEELEARKKELHDAKQQKHALEKKHHQDQGLHQKALDEQTVKIKDLEKVVAEQTHQLSEAGKKDRENSAALGSLQKALQESQTLAKGSSAQAAQMKAKLEELSSQIAKQKEEMEASRRAQDAQRAAHASELQAQSQKHSEVEQGLLNQVQILKQQAEGLQKARDAQKTSLLGHQQDLQAIKAHAKDLEDQLKHHHGDSSQVKDQLAQSRLQAEALEKQITDQKKELDDHRKTDEANRSRIQRLEEQISQAQNSITQNSSETARQTAALQKEVSDLQKEVAKRKQETEAQVKANTALVGAQDGIQKINEHLQRQVEQSNEKVNKLESTIRAKEEDSQQLQIALDQTNRKLADHEREARAEKQKLEREVIDLKENARRHAESAEKASSHAPSASSSLSTSPSLSSPPPQISSPELETIQKRYDEQQAQLQNTIQSLAEAQAANDQLKQKLKQREEQGDSKGPPSGSQNEVETLRRQVRDSQALSQRALSDLEVLRASHEKLLKDSLDQQTQAREREHAQTSTEQLRREAKEEQAQLIKDHEEKQKAMHDELKKSEASVRSLQEKLKALPKDADPKALSALQALLSEKEKKLEELSAQHESDSHNYRQQIDQLKTQLTQRRNQEEGKHPATHSHLESQTHNLQQEDARLVHEQQSSGAQFARLKRDHEHLQKELSRHTNSLSSAQKEAYDREREIQELRQIAEDRNRELNQRAQIIADLSDQLRNRPSAPSPSIQTSATAPALQGGWGLPSFLRGGSALNSPPISSSSSSADPQTALLQQIRGLQLELDQERRASEDYQRRISDLENQPAGPQSDAAMNGLKAELSQMASRNQQLESELHSARRALRNVSRSYPLPTQATSSLSSSGSGSTLSSFLNRLPGLSTSPSFSSSSSSSPPPFFSFTPPTDDANALSQARDSLQAQRNRIDLLDQQLSTKNDELSRVKRDLEEAKKKERDPSRGSSDQTKAISDLEEDLSRRQKESQNLHAAVKTLQSNLNQAEETIRGLENDQVQAQTDQSVHRDTQAKLGKSQNLNRTLNQEVKKIREQLAQTSSQVEDLEQKNQKNEDDIRRSAEIAGKNNQQIQHLTSQLQDSQTQASQARQKLVEQETAAKSLRDENSKHQAVIRQKDSEITDLKKKVQNLERESKSSGDDHSSEISQLQNRISNLESENQALKTKTFSQSSSASPTSPNQTQALQSQLLESQADQLKAQAQQTLLEQRLAAQEVKAAQEIQSREAEIQQLKKEQIELNRRKPRSRTRSQSLERQIESLQNENQLQAQTLQSLREDRARQFNQNQTWAQEQIHQGEQQIAQLKQQIRDLQAPRSPKSEKVEDQSATIEALRKKLSDLESAHENLKKQSSSSSPIQSSIQTQTSPTHLGISPQLLEAEAQQTRLQEKLSELEAKANEDIRRRDEKIDQLTQEIDHLKKERIRLPSGSKSPKRLSDSTMAKLQAKVSQLQNQNAAQKKELQTHRESLPRLISQAQGDALEKIRQGEEQVVELRQQIEGLKSQAQSSRSMQSEDDSALIREMQKTVDSLESENSALKKRLSLLPSPNRQATLGITHQEKIDVLSTSSASTLEPSSTLTVPLTPSAQTQGSGSGQESRRLTLFPSTPNSLGPHGPTEESKSPSSSAQDEQINALLLENQQLRMDYVSQKSARKKLEQLLESARRVMAENDRLYGNMDQDQQDEEKIRKFRLQASVLIPEAEAKLALKAKRLKETRDSERKKQRQEIQKLVEQIQASTIELSAREQRLRERAALLPPAARSQLAPLQQERDEDEKEVQTLNQVNNRMVIHSLMNGLKIEIPTGVEPSDIVKALELKVEQLKGVIERDSALRAMFQTEDEKGKAAAGQSRDIDLKKTELLKWMSDLKINLKQLAFSPTEQTVKKTCLAEIDALEEAVGAILGSGSRAHQELVKIEMDIIVQALKIIDGFRLKKAMRQSSEGCCASQGGCQTTLDPSFNRLFDVLQQIQKRLGE